MARSTSSLLAPGPGSSRLQPFRDEDGRDRLVQGQIGALQGLFGSIQGEQGSLQGEIGSHQGVIGNLQAARSSASDDLKRAIDGEI